MDGRARRALVRLPSAGNGFDEGMDMYYCYLFEAKSIQAYLFQSSKLRDVISASERLDRLIDSSPNSVLAQVIEVAKLPTDLLSDVSDNEHTIHFLRCKGGAFYAYCRQQTPLLSLRNTWTLTLSQLFPSMVFTDAFSEAESLQQAMALGLKRLNTDRNNPRLLLPTATAPVKRAARTGKGAVPLSRLAQYGSVKEDSELDLDTELHRQAYQAFAMRDSAALQDRFTPPELKEQICYPLNFETQFPFSGTVDLLTQSQREAIKDMALIHIDGNGLGILLRQLKQVLQTQPVEEYRRAFRAFSEALAQATQLAAQQATRVLYQQVVGDSSHGEPVMLPMRPIVLGGDDVTLFCRADLALEYARTFCMAFKQSSQNILASLYQEYLAGSGIKPYLTASGGVLFHKAGHPFMHSHQLVEGLCEQAKKLTNSIYGTPSNKVGPAALALYRVSNATQSDVESLIQQAQTFPLSSAQRICLTQTSYFVSMTSDEQQALEKETGEPLKHNRCLDKLQNLIPRDRANAVMPMGKWRQLATLLSQRDFAEAQRLYNRALSLCSDKTQLQQFRDLVAALAPTANEQVEWAWQEEGQWRTFINDLLLVDHFQPVSYANDAKEAVE